MKRVMDMRGLALVSLLAVAGAGAAGCSESKGAHRVEHQQESMGLGVGDFQDASTQLTNKMLSVPRMQEELKEITATLRQNGEARRPLIKITRIKDNTGLIPPINMAEYLVEPMEEVF